MLAEYTIKFTLDNGDSFSLGMLSGAFLVAATIMFAWWWEK
jgi:hypothetical protein